MSKNRKANNIRIISGRWRGTRLPVLDSVGLRPTTDRVRETVFNWLMHDVSGARCLDLFAGSGALGFECLSRSAAFVKFVEQEKQVAAQLNENLQRLSAPASQASVYAGDAITFLHNQECDPFDVVFLDPPFHSNLVENAAIKLEKGNCLASGALIYVEQAATSDKFLAPENWQLKKQSKAGMSVFALYHRR